MTQSEISNGLLTEHAEPPAREIVLERFRTGLFERLENAPVDSPSPEENQEPEGVIAEEETSDVSETADLPEAEASEEDADDASEDLGEEEASEEDADDASEELPEAGEEPEADDDPASLEGADD